VFGHESTIYFERKKAIKQFEDLCRNSEYGYIRKVSFIKKSSKIIKTLSDLSRSEKLNLSKFSIESFEHYWNVSE